MVALSQFIAEPMRQCSRMPRFIGLARASVRRLQRVAEAQRLREGRACHLLRLARLPFPCAVETVRPKETARSRIRAGFRGVRRGATDGGALFSRMGRCSGGCVGRGESMELGS